VNTRIIDADLGECACLRCGAEAQWRYVDEARTTVELDCPDCGRFEVPRADFDRAESEIAQPNDRRD
jgi:predicted RNA-binding Zn-ribbon protein involved in translation (DUF1610 family)